MQEPFWQSGSQATK